MSNMDHGEFIDRMREIIFDVDITMFERQIRARQLFMEFDKDE